jgi:hypothetical protein
MQSYKVSIKNQKGEIDVDQLCHNLLNIINTQDILGEALNRGKALDRLLIDLFNKVTRRMRDLVSAINEKSMGGKKL